MIDVCFYIIFAYEDPECSSCSLTGLALRCSQGVKDSRIGFNDLVKKRFDASHVSDIWVN